MYQKDQRREDALNMTPMQPKMIFTEIYKAILIKLSLTYKEM